MSPKLPNPNQKTNALGNARLKYEAPVVDQLSVGGDTQGVAKAPLPFEGTTPTGDTLAPVIRHYGTDTGTGS